MSLCRINIHFYWLGRKWRWSRQIWYHITKEKKKMGTLLKHNKCDWNTHIQSTCTSKCRRILNKGPQSHSSLTNLSFNCVPFDVMNSCYYNSGDFHVSTSAQRLRSSFEDRKNWATLSKAVQVTHARTFCYHLVNSLLKWIKKIC